MCSNPAPKRKGEPECKPNPSLPAQVQPLGPWDVPSCPGNVFPGHAVSISLSSLSWSCWDHPPLLCWLSLLRRDTSCWGWGNRRRTRTRTRTCFSEEHSCLQLLLWSIVSMDGPPKSKPPSLTDLRLPRGQEWTQFPAAPSKLCHRQRSEA